MTEMLGTLAIMGILTLTGIKLFSSAMDSHHANTVLYEVNKRAMACAFEVNLLDRNPCLLGEYPNQIDDKYSVSALRISTGSFEITVADVPKSICTKILAQGMPNAGDIYPKTCAQTNTMRFLFNAKLTGGEENLCYSCPAATPKCCAGVCCECQTDADCAENTAFGAGYSCQSNMCMATPADWCQECLDNGQFCNYSNGSTTKGSCASKATTPVQTQDGKTYYTASVQTSWYGAKSFCTVNNMHLVPVDAVCLGKNIEEECSNIPSGNRWYWTSTPKNAINNYIIINHLVSKGWNKATNSGGVYPLCAP